MSKSFSSEALRKEAYGLEEFEELGGREKGLYMPLAATVSGEVFVFFFVFTVTDEMPGAFVFCKNGADPCYVEYGDGLEKLGVSEEDIIVYGDDPDGIPEGELPTDIYARFDAAYNDGSVDHAAYRDYLDTLIAASTAGLRKYLEVLGYSPVF